MNNFKLQSKTTDGKTRFFFLILMANYGILKLAEIAKQKKMLLYF